MRPFATGWVSASRVAATIALLVLVAVGGCADPAKEAEELAALLERGEYLILEAEWEEARVVLRQYLLDDPYHSGAHFYLGRAYLFSQDFRPEIAEGELQTALKLFRTRGRKSLIERYPDDYFEMICSVESAKVALMQLEMYRALGLPAGMVTPLAARARDHLNEAKAVMPDSPDVTSLEGLLDDMGIKPARPLPFVENRGAAPNRA